MTSIVKMMKEQGNQFDWSQVVLDFAGLPCFKQGEDLPSSYDPKGGDVPTIFLADGYTIVGGSWVVKVTGEEPSVNLESERPVFTDCEPVLVDMSNLSPLSPVRVIQLIESDELPFIPVVEVSDTFMSAVYDVRPIFWLDKKGIPGAVVLYD